MAVTFAGLGSGLDTTSLIKQLVAASKAPEATLQTEQSNLASQKQVVNELATALADFGTYADSVSLTSDTQFRAGVASDSHVSVAVSGSAAATPHSVRVDQVAQAQVTSSQTFTTNAAGMVGIGGVSWQIGTGAATTVSWDASDTLDTIASKINDKNAGVSASVLFDGSAYRLMVTASKTGGANTPTFTETGVGIGLSDPANVKIPAQDAKVTIDGVQITRPTNVIDDALAGVTLTANSAQAATDPNTTVSVTLDHTAAATKLGGLVTAYNNIMSTLNDQLTYKGSTAGADTLFADPDLEGLQNAMTALVSRSFGGATLDGLGLSIDKTGVMSLDTTKLDTALNSNPNALADVFASGGAGAALRQLTTTYTDPVDGVLTGKLQGFVDQTKSLQDQIDQIDANALALQTRLQDQFNALEATMSALNNQSTAIGKILGTTTTSSK